MCPIRTLGYPVTPTQKNILPEEDKQKKGDTMSILKCTPPWLIVSVCAVSMPSKAFSNYSPKTASINNKRFLWKKSFSSPQVTKHSSCNLHKITVCPICEEEEYMRKRLTNAVLRALKRLNVAKRMSILTYLGASSWKEVLCNLAMKREAWNKLHPTKPMNITNTALDHIKPVNSFKNNSLGEKTMLCNHFTNLQPLLHEDNIWKADFWSQKDENHWLENIIFQPHFYTIYYPKTAPCQPSLLNYTK